MDNSIFGIQNELKSNFKTGTMIISLKRICSRHKTPCFKTPNIHVFDSPQPQIGTNGQSEHSDVYLPSSKHKGFTTTWLNWCLSFKTTKYLLELCTHTYVLTIASTQANRSRWQNHFLRCPFCWASAYLQFSCKSKYLHPNYLMGNVKRRIQQPVLSS